MKAKTNSLHAKLYRFAYSSELPSNLCPYFWRLLWALMAFIPTLVIRLPIYIFDLFLSTKINTKDEDRDDVNALGILSYYAFIIVSIYFWINYEWIKAMAGCYSYSCIGANIAIFVNSVIALIAIIKIAQAIRGKKEHSSIIVEFIKSKYSKYCPKIEWEENK